MGRKASGRAGGCRALGLMAGLLLCGLQGAGWAVQPAPAVPVEASLETPVAFRLDDKSPMEGRNRYRDHRILLTAGQSVQIDMSSTDFDPAIVLLDGQAAQRLAADDDGGISVNARLRFTAPQSGAYMIRARAVDGGSGAYILAMSSLDAAAALAKELAPDNLVTDRLGDKSPLLLNSSPYAVYSLRGVAGDRFKIEMRSLSDFDPRLEIWRKGEESRFAENDDFDAGQNARLFVELPAEGTYIVRAIGSSQGEFEIKAERIARAPAAIGELRPGETVQSRLELSDPATDDGLQITGFYKLFRLPVREGQRLVPVVSSADFPAIVEIGMESPIGFAVAWSNAEAVPGNRAAGFAARADATVLVRVRSLNNRTGPFSLTLSSPAP